MNDLPTREELEKAVGKLKMTRQVKTPEMVKVVWDDDEFTYALMELVQNVCRESLWTGVLYCHQYQRKAT